MSVDEVVHPGELIRDTLTARGMTQKALADATGLTPKHISRVVRGLSGIGTLGATQIGEVLDISPRLLIRMQADYDVVHCKPRSRI